MCLFLSLVCSMKEREGKVAFETPFNFVLTQQVNIYKEQHSKRTIIASIQYCSNSSVTFVWKFTTVYISHTDYIRICLVICLRFYFYNGKNHILHTAQHLHLKRLLMTVFHVTKIIPLQNIIKLHHLQ